MQSVGYPVEMECGIKQGRLASAYEAKWVYRNYELDDRNVEEINDEEVKVKREELQDYALEISPLRLTDSGSYTHLFGDN